MVRTISFYFPFPRIYKAVNLHSWSVHGFPSQSKSLLHDLIISLQVKTELKHVLEAQARLGVQLLLLSCSHVF